MEKGVKTSRDVTYPAGRSTCLNSYLRWAQRNFPPCSRLIWKQKSAHASFCTDKVTHSTEGTRRKTHLWVEGDFKTRLGFSHIVIVPNWFHDNLNPQHMKSTKVLKQWYYLAQCSIMKESITIVGLKIHPRLLWVPAVGQYIEIILILW